MPIHTLTLTDQPDPGLAEAVRENLYLYNRATIGHEGYRPLCVFAHSEDGSLLGGLLGGTYWNWLVVDILWIAEGARRQGLGTEILRTAEAEAMARGCTRVHLDTHDFQAPKFYSKHGYTVFGELHGQPEGHTRFYLAKVLP
jgi:GNAT superfamily N-acetyltransferase